MRSSTSRCTPDKVYAGGTFTAGDSGAENLAVWDGTSWEPFCGVTGESIGNVKALQVIGQTLYVGGEFQDGGGVPPPTTCSRATWHPAGTPERRPPTRPIRSPAG